MKFTIKKKGELKIVGKKVEDIDIFSRDEIVVRWDEIGFDEYPILEWKNCSLYFGLISDFRKKSTYFFAKPISEIPFTLKGDFVSEIIPSIEYAVFKHKGSSIKVIETYELIENKLMENGLTKHPNLPYIELFDKKQNHTWNHELLEFEIYVPVLNDYNIQNKTIDC
ncbi:GyrI-like domain-containing protein [Bacillus sp. CGMCC 1.16607]|uniref:GyrI-like domain-containing protein n=1 Tax=Bacillus sp. CGMCC 1.16607 TaxID=3351842 RepID=UPI003642A6B0